MNDRDRQNLEFLLHASEDTLRDWYRKMPPQDHDYALELLNAWADELRARSAALLVQSTLALHDTLEVALGDTLYSEAAVVLAKYRRNGG